MPFILNCYCYTNSASSLINHFLVCRFYSLISGDDERIVTSSFFFCFSLSFFLLKMYSPDKYEIVAEVNSVACITIVSLIFGRKLASIDGSIRYVRSLLLAFYLLTWAFCLIACMLTSTNNGNYISCALTNFNCFLVYSFAKIILYLYFIEKVRTISLTFCLITFVDTYHISPTKSTLAIASLYH